MPRIYLTEEEYAEVTRFARERNMNPKEAVLAFVRAGNRVSSSKLNLPDNAGESRQIKWQEQTDLTN